MPSTKCGFHSVPGGASGADLLAAFGPTLLVDIGFDPAFTAKSGFVPVAGIKGIQALVDTGAAESCIDALLATQLNLPVIDRRVVSGSAGSHEVNMYLAQIVVPTLTWTIYGAFAGVHLSAGGQYHKALIGRTFLSNHTMIYNGLTGEVVLSR
jgi:hypothetical protein